MQIKKHRVNLCLIYVRIWDKFWSQSVKSQGVVNLIDFIFRELVEVTVGIFNDWQSVYFLWGDADHSTSTLTSFKAVGVCVIVTAVFKARGITSEISSNLSHWCLKVSHSSLLSSLMVCVSYLEVRNKLLAHLIVSLSDGAYVSHILASKCLLLGISKVRPFACASSLLLEASLSLSSSDISKIIWIYTLSGLCFITVSSNGKGVDDLNVPLSEWLKVLSKRNIFSNFIFWVGHWDVVYGLVCVISWRNHISLSPGIKVRSSVSDGVIVPWYLRDLEIRCGNRSKESKNCKIHIFLFL